MKRDVWIIVAKKIGLKKIQCKDKGLDQMIRAQKINPPMKSYQAMLLSKRNEVLENVTELEYEFIRPETNERLRFPTHPAEVGTDNFDLENTATLLESERKILKDIDRALECLEQGIYGFCEACHVQIPLKRLQAMPWARLCVDCAEKLEKNKPTPRRAFFRMRRFPY